MRSLHSSRTGSHLREEIQSDELILANDDRAEGGRNAACIVAQVLNNGPYRSPTARIADFAVRKAAFEKALFLSSETSYKVKGNTADFAEDGIEEEKQS